MYCEIVPHDAAWEDVQGLNPKGVILSGGPASVYEEGAPLAPGWVYDGGLPLLGICYGMQAMVHQLGGGVGRTDAREYGPATLHLNSSDSPLFDGLPGSFPVWMSHGDHITATPPGFEPLAYSDNSPIAALGNGNGAYGIQFHAEVEHTPLGKALLENFLFKVGGCEGEWSAANFVERSVNEIRETVGEGKVICALSGGVDSAVTAALVHRAIGDQLTCVFVNKRADAARRAGGDSKRVRAPGPQPGARRRPPRASSERSGASPTRSESGLSSVRSSSACSRSRPRASATWTIWRRVRSIQTSSRARRPRARKARG